jgi:3',5'-cyclic AMP phosphodiesterase CpdA
MHHPPFDVAPDYRDGYRRSEDATALAALVSRHPQVERILCGHVHRWHRESWAGTLATTMPSVAVDLRKGVAAEIGAAPVYMLHSVSPDGSIVSRMCVA